MAQTAGPNMTIITAANPTQQAEAQAITGRVRCFTEIVTYTTNASGDTILVGQIPAGATFEGLAITTDTSTSSGTLAFGDGTTAGKFAAAAALTATNTPTLRGTAATLGVIINANAPTNIVITVGTASLPASGTLVVQTYYKLD